MNNWFQILIKLWDWKRGDWNEKRDKHGWRTISFEKNILWSFNLNNHANYIILVPQNCSNSILVQRFIFVTFWFPVEREEREGLLNFSGRERNLALAPILATKIGDFYVKLFHLMIKVHIMCFCTLKVREK